MMLPYGMDVPIWFCPMRPAALDAANAWEQANYGHPIQIITNLIAYWSRNFPQECQINDNYWVPRWNGVGPPPPSASFFPADYRSPLKPYWLVNQPTLPTFAIYGWARRLHDIGVPYVPFVSDLAASGQGNGFVSPYPGSPAVTNISPNTAHFVNGTLIGVNGAYADGHVANHTPNQIRAVYVSGGYYWFY